MSKFYVINLIDKIFITVSVFLIIYAWINFYLRDLKTTFVLSLIFSFAIVFILFYFINKKQNIKIQSKEKLKKLEKTYFAFKVLSRANQLKLINSILLRDYSSEIKSNCIVYQFEGKKHIFLIHSNLTITQSDLFSILNNLNSNFDTLHIACENIANNLQLKIFKNKNIEVIDKNSLYENFFEKSNIFPNTENLNYEKLKPSYKNVLKNFISPDKSKRYFLCGLLLIFSSLIIPMQTYYFIFGSIFLLLGIVCKLKKYVQHKSSSMHKSKN